MVSPKQQWGRGHLPGDGGVPCTPSALLLRSHGNPRPRQLHPDADFSSLSTEIRGTKRNKTIRQCLQGSARSHSSRADLPLPRSHAEANAEPILGCFSLLPLSGGNRTGRKTPAQLNSPPSPRIHPTGTTTTEPRPTALPSPPGCPEPAPAEAALLCGAERRADERKRGNGKPLHYGDWLKEQPTVPVKVQHWRWLGEGNTSTLLPGEGFRLLRWEEQPIFQPWGTTRTSIPGNPNLDSEFK